MKFATRDSNGTKAVWELPIDYSEDGVIEAFLEVEKHYAHLELEANVTTILCLAHDNSKTSVSDNG